MAKGRRTKLDLTEIELEYHPDEKFYMFLSLSWGYIADVDIKSEALRWAGPLRMILWGIWYIINRHFYKGIFKFTGVEVS